MIKYLLKAIRKAVEKGFSMLGAVWTVMEVVGWCFPEWWFVAFYNENSFIVILPGILSALYTLYVELRCKIECEIRAKKVVICVGNLLNKKDGTVVIGINQELETNKDKVAENSIHWQMIQKYGQDKMDAVFKVEREKRGKKCFFKARLDGRDYLFLCMSALKDGVASTNLQMLHTAVRDIFVKAEATPIRNHRIYFPVLGTGAGGLRIAHGEGSNDKTEAVKRIIKWFFDFELHAADAVQNRIDEIKIVVYWKDIRKIKWEELNLWLKRYKDYCIDCNEYKDSLDVAAEKETI